MEFSKHNWATISETICPEMLIFDKYASWTLFFQNILTNTIISEILFLWRHHFSTLYMTYLNASPFVWKQMKVVLCSIVACSARSCSIVHLFDFRTFDCVRLAKCFGEFDYRPQSKSIERLEFDWVRLPNVRLTTPEIFQCFGLQYTFFRLVRRLRASSTGTNFALGSSEKFQSGFRDENRPNILATISGAKCEKANMSKHKNQS